MFHVYQIINLINGKIYVGQTNNIVRRWHEHTATAHNENKPQKPIHKAIKKYGTENFDFRIIQSVPTFQDALASEIYWIAFYKTNITRYGDEFGYNLSDGGDGGGAGPKSQAHKDNIGKANAGKIRTENMRMNLSEAKSSLTKVELTHIKQLLLDNFSTYRIAKMFGISQGAVSDIKLGKSHRYFFTDENIKAFDIRKKDLSGEKNGAARLNEQQVREIRGLLKDSVSSSKIAKLYGVGKSTILRIKNHQSWAHIK